MAKGKAPNGGKPKTKILVAAAALPAKNAKPLLRPRADAWHLLFRGTTGHVGKWWVEVSGCCWQMLGDDLGMPNPDFEHILKLQEISEWEPKMK